MSHCALALPPTQETPGKSRLSLSLLPPTTNILYFCFQASAVSKKIQADDFLFDSKNGPSFDWATPPLVVRPYNDLPFLAAPRIEIQPYGVDLHESRKRVV